MATYVVQQPSVLPNLPLHMLERWTPLRPVANRLGELYLTPIAKSRMIPDADGRDSLRSATGAAFDQFVELGTAVHGLFNDSWGRLGIAQLKVLSPTPGARLIGGFVNPLLFVGLRLYWRDELDFKQTGQKGLIDYRSLGQVAQLEWDATLPGIRRIPMKELRG